MLETPREYLDTLDEPARTWVADMLGYVERTYPSLTVTMFRQRPMAKVGDTWTDGYVMVTAAATHGTVHTLDFDLVAGMTELLPRARLGKGSVKVRYDDTDAVPVLHGLVDRVMARHGVPRA